MDIFRFGRQRRRERNLAAFLVMKFGMTYNSSDRIGANAGIGLQF